MSNRLYRLFKLVAMLLLGTLTFRHGPPYDIVLAAFVGSLQLTCSHAISLLLSE